VFHGIELLGAILILVIAPDSGTLSHEWHFTKQDGNRIQSDNTKERHRLHATQSTFISKTGPQYAQDLRYLESKEFAFALVRRFFSPVKFLRPTMKRFLNQ
jgi:hypothetical protein